MSRQVNWHDPYTSTRIPLEYSEARLRFVKRLERAYERALDQRCEECKKQGIEYRHGICGRSPDEATATLESLYLDAHKEAVLLPLEIITVERKLGLRSWIS